AVRKALLDEETATRLEEQVRRHAQESHAAEERAAVLTAELGEERVTDKKLAAAVTTEVENALGKEKKLEEQTARMKERLERSQDLRKQLAIAEAALPVYDLLAGDLRSDRFQAYVLHEVLTELVEG